MKQFLCLEYALSEFASYALGLRHTQSFSKAVDSQVHGGDWWRVFLATHHLLNAQYAKPNKEMQSDTFILFNLYDCLLKSPLTG